MADVLIKVQDGDYKVKIKIEDAQTVTAHNIAETVNRLKDGFTGICEEQKDKKIAEMESSVPGVRQEVVAIYDNSGIPSFMYRFTKKKNSELFNGGGKDTHTAFIIDGKEYDEIYISVYENCNINGKPYSLPYMKPWTDINNDDAAKVCFSKGEGWHLLTMAEWGLMANICKTGKTLPHGNTNYGKYHANENETGAKIDNGNITYTGTGPAIWTHNHEADGVHDLCGNVWEMVRGFRVKDGAFETVKDNDAAMDIDLGKDSRNWKSIVDDKTGLPVRVNVEGGEIEITSSSQKDDEGDYTGDRWDNVVIDYESEKMMELALYPGESNAYLYVDSTEGEYFPFCGGSWYNGGNAGVFCVNLGYPRSGSSCGIGFRSAYYRKLDN